MRIEKSPSETTKASPHGKTFRANTAQPCGESSSPREILNRLLWNNKSCSAPPALPFMICEIYFRLMLKRVGICGRWFTSFSVISGETAEKRRKLSYRGGREIRTTLAY